MEKHERLRLARIEAGYASAAEAARRLSLPYGTYSGHENGQRGMGDNDIRTYAKAFKRSMSWLAFGTDEATGQHVIPVKGHIMNGGSVVEDPKKVFPDHPDFGEIRLPIIVPPDIVGYQVGLFGYSPGMMTNDVVLVKGRPDLTIEDGVRSMYIARTEDGFTYLGELIPDQQPEHFTIVCPNRYAIKSKRVIWIGEIYAIIPWLQHMRQGLQEHREGEARRTYDLGSEPAHE